MGKSDDSGRQIIVLRKKLLRWYVQHRRELPWRASRDPYAIWISEIMLQQTRVAVVIERYRAFLERFPTLPLLALAGEQEVLAAWSGLGYYRRARMLRQAAQVVALQHDAALPASSQALRKLPGIGAYTAAAVASIAYGECVALVDGNVERVLCRLQGWDAPGGATAGKMKRRIAALAATLVDPKSPGDFNQALMELGATVCAPRTPRCFECPISALCKTRGEHKSAPRPRMASREAAHALSLRRRKGSGAREVLLEQRPRDLTVMPGLWELPALRVPSLPASETQFTLRHAIMQVNYYVRIRAVEEGDVERLTIPGGRRKWVNLEDTPHMALTGLTRKALKRADLLPADSPAPGQ